MIKASKDDAKQIIIETVDSLQGCKATSLVAEIAGYNELLEFTSDELLSILDELIASGEIVEIEYVLPTMTYRTKSFLLPKGTEISIKKS